MGAVSWGKVHGVLGVGKGGGTYVLGVARDLGLVVVGNVVNGVAHTTVLGLAHVKVVRGSIFLEDDILQHGILADGAVDVWLRLRDRDDERDQIRGREKEAAHTLMKRLHIMKTKQFQCACCVPPR